MNRRMFLAATAAGIARAAAPEWEKPLFDLPKKVTSPVKIQSIEVLQNGKSYFVRSTSTDGATGIALAKIRSRITCRF